MLLMKIQTALRPGVRLFLVGIGGVSMSSLAEVLHCQGLTVAGSDRQESGATRRLSALGVTVHIAEDPSLLDGADAVIRTAAAREDHPLILAARAKGLPVFERAEAWGELSKAYTNAICVAGTHGKTTTTGMLAHITLQNGDPTIMLGGTLPLLNGTYRAGHDTIVLESCEYRNSYHYFSPTIAVVLNVEADHLDFFRDMDDILNSFACFCALTPERGHIILNAEDKGCQSLICRLGERGNLLRFSLAGEADVRAHNLRTEHGCYAFDVTVRGQPYTSVKLAVPGRHNASNALAACAAAWAAGIPGADVSAGLSAFTGTGRRLEHLGECNGVPVYDDYAHHPTEITASLEALKTMGNRVLLVFQPHTYSRTKALFHDFVQALGCANVLFLAEIYAAREVNTDGLSSADLQANIYDSTYAESFEELADKVRERARPGDVICVMGAGDIRRLGEMLVADCG